MATGNDKKILIICVSSYNGNTIRIANAMARVLYAKVVSPDECTQNQDLAHFDVIGFGSGINFGRHNPALLEFVNSLPPMNKEAFIFSTRANPFLGKYHDCLRNALKDKGFKLVGEFSTVAFDGTGPFSIVGGVHKGRPHEGDQRRAEAFARSLQISADGTHLQLEKKLRKHPNQQDKLKIYQEEKLQNNRDLHGNLVVVDWNACIGCGKCQEHCPLGVYDIVQVRIASHTVNRAIATRELDCVKCKTCKNGCPRHAIMLCGTWKDSIRVAKRHADR